LPYAAQYNQGFSTNKPKQTVVRSLISFAMDGGGDPERQQALESYKNKLLESREWEAKLKALRMDIKGLQKSFETTEDNIKALQSVGQIIGEVLKQLDDERCMYKPVRSDGDFSLLTLLRADEVVLQSS
jgi:ATP-dependent 26S proteasome regulatory subunit